MTTVDIPAVDKAYALARLDALVCEHGLPVPERAWLDHHDEDHLQVCVGIDPAVLFVRAAERAHVPRWAAVLGVKPETTHMIHEYDDGRWCASWGEVAQLRGWLPGLKLRVYHNEDRWIVPPAGAR